MVISLVNIPSILTYHGSTRPFKRVWEWFLEIDSNALVYVTPLKLDGTRRVIFVCHTSTFGM